MNNWNSFKDGSPIEGSWVLVGYWLNANKYPERIWCKRIVQYSNDDPRNIKFTHWIYINPHRNYFNQVISVTDCSKV